MRGLLAVMWLMVPVLFGAWHYGPGQAYLLEDEIGKQLQAASAFANAQQWSQAEEAYDAALKLIPSERVALARRTKLERCKVQLRNEKLPNAHDELAALVDELVDDPNADPQLSADARATFAGSRYYMTWLMRLEGEPREVWEPEIDSARQTYRLLAEAAAQAGNEDQAKARQQDLEAAIRLARIDLKELQGLPLPKQCKGCCSGKCKNPGKKAQKNQQPKQPKDNRSAGNGPPPDGSGH